MREFPITVGHDHARGYRVRMAAVDRVKAAAAELAGRNLSLEAALEEVCSQENVSHTKTFIFFDLGRLVWTMQGRLLLTVVSCKQ